MVTYERERVLVAAERCDLELTARIAGLSAVRVVVVRAEEDRDATGLEEEGGGRGKRELRPG